MKKIAATVFLFFQTGFYLCGTAAAGEAREASASAPSCAVANGLPLAPEMQMIKAADQTFFTLFTSHLSTESQEFIKLPPLPDGVAETELFLLKNSQTIEEERRDFSLIVQTVSSHPEIRWIGIEDSHTELEEFSIENRVKNYLEMKSFLLLTGSLNEEKTAAALSLLFPAAIIALAERPDLFQAVRFVPLDDYSYRQKSLALIDEIQEGRRRIIDRSLQIHFPFSEFQKLEDVQWEHLAAGRIISPQTAEPVLKRLKDSHLKTLAERYFFSMNRFIEASRARDKIMADAIFKQAGTGLILLGSKHADGVTERLLSLCRKKQKAGATRPWQRQ